MTQTANVSNDAVRSLRRAGLEPARVFGRADFTDKRSMVYFLGETARRVTWYMPDGGAWLIRRAEGETCSVIERACERYGDAVPVKYGEMRQHVLRMLEVEGTPIEMPPLEDVETGTLRDGTEFPAFVMHLHQENCLTTLTVPATPVSYFVRRYGTALSWEVVESPRQGVDNDGQGQGRLSLRCKADGDTVGFVAVLQTTGAHDEA